MKKHRYYFLDNSYIKDEEVGYEVATFQIEDVFYHTPMRLFRSLDEAYVFLTKAVENKDYITDRDINSTLIKGYRKNHYLAVPYTENELDEMRTLSIHQ